MFTDLNDSTHKRSILYEKNIQTPKGVPGYKVNKCKLMAILYTHEYTDKKKLTTVLFQIAEMILKYLESICFFGR